MKKKKNTYVEEEEKFRIYQMSYDRPYDPNKNKFQPSQVCSPFFGTRVLDRSAYRDNKGVVDPDLNYDCEIPGKDCFCEKVGECFCNIQEHSTWQYYDVRSECQLRYDCLKDDFEPTYYENVNKFAFMYTVSSSEGILIQADKKMTSDSKDVVYLYNQTIRINAEPLSDGDYVVEFWPIAIENAQKRILRFSVKNGVASKGPSFVKRPYIGIQTFGSSIQISSSISQPYVIFSSMGQTITRGSVKGTINVKMPSAGIYLVKVGAEMLRIKVFE